MADYDFQKSFARIEEELLRSMMRNMQRHKAWEDKEGFNWSMWQAEQLKALNVYKQRNQKQFGKEFGYINAHIQEVIKKARVDGNLNQEAEILEALKKGYKPPPKRSKSVKTQAAFFRLNDRKIDALIKATISDVQQAERAILRMANDKYRKVIFDAQVYANSGAGTYEKAVDMATRDFLSSGLNCVEYANGARHTLQDYADMAIRTASKRAYLTGEGEKRKEWGISTVIVNKRGNPCPKCLPFVGKVFIDDVWSGGKKSDSSYPLLSSAIAAGLYHPRCKDSHTTYFPGISTSPEKFRKIEIETIKQEYRKEQAQNYAHGQHRKFRRLERFSLDMDNKQKYRISAERWSVRQRYDIIETDENFKKNITYGLPEISSVNDDNGRKRFAEALVDRIGIRRDSIGISVKNAWGNRGYCAFSHDDVKDGICRYNSYVLQSNDDRDIRYKLKTAFHESFHLSQQGRKWDALKNGEVSEKWRVIEETFAESAAQYAVKMYGIADDLAPSYSDLLIQTLPRIKKLDKYSLCNKIEDFGRIACSDRLNGKGGIWEPFFNDMYAVSFNDAQYYGQYFYYIEKHEQELLRKVFENSPAYERQGEIILDDLHNAMKSIEEGKTLSSLNNNERIIFSEFIINAMRKEGIK